MLCSIKVILHSWCDILTQTPAQLIETNLICFCVLCKIVYYSNQITPDTLIASWQFLAAAHSAAPVTCQPPTMLEFSIKMIPLLNEADLFVWMVAPSGFALHPC